MVSPDRIGSKETRREATGADFELSLPFAVVAAEAGSQDVESLKLERTMVEDELKQFLQEYQVSLPLSFHPNCLSLKLTIFLLSSRTVQPRSKDRLRPLP